MNNLPCFIALPRRLRWSFGLVGAVSSFTWLACSTHPIEPTQPSAVPFSCETPPAALPAGRTWRANQADPPSCEANASVKRSLPRAVGATTTEVFALNCSTASAVERRALQERLASTDQSDPLIVEVEGTCGPLDPDASESILITRSHVTLRGKPGARICGATPTNGMQDCPKATTKPGENGRESVLVRIMEPATDVVVEDLIFENYWTKDPGKDAIAVSVERAKRVLIQGNTVRNGGVDWESAYNVLTTDERTRWRERDSNADPETDSNQEHYKGDNVFDPADFGASAFKLWGAWDVTILDNEISRLHLGFSEAIAIVQGSRSFAVLGNMLKGVDNIGIDVRGDDEGVSSGGVICENVLTEFQCGNPAYGNPRGGTLCRSCAPEKRSDTPGDVAPTCVCEPLGEPCYGRRQLRPNAGGIYVDGGKNVVIARNVVRGWDYGVQVSSEENVQPPVGVVVQENLLLENFHSAVHLGYRGANDGKPGDCGTRATHNKFTGSWSDANEGIFIEPPTPDGNECPVRTIQDNEVCLPPKQGGTGPGG